MEHYQQFVRKNWTKNYIQTMKCSNYTWSFIFLKIRCFYRSCNIQTSSLLHGISESNNLSNIFKIIMFIESTFRNERVYFNCRYIIYHVILHNTKVGWYYHVFCISMHVKVVVVWCLPHPHFPFIYSNHILYPFYPFWLFLLLISSFLTSHSYVINLELCILN